jgi:hypothetical protein
MPQYRITARLLVNADNQAAALEVASAVIEGYDPTVSRYHCTTGLDAAELRIEKMETRSQGAAA